MAKKNYKKESRRYKDRVYWNRVWKDFNLWTKKTGANWIDQQHWLEQRVNHKFGWLRHKR